MLHQLALSRQMGRAKAYRMQSRKVNNHRYQIAPCKHENVGYCFEDNHTYQR